MVHPSFDILIEFLKTGEPADIAGHVGNCEQCLAITEGIKIAEATSQKKGVQLDALLAESKESTLAIINEARESEKTLAPRLAPWWRLVAASVVLLVGVVFYFNVVRFDADDYVNQQIAIDRPQPNTERSMISGANKEWSLFVQHYNNGDYLNALTQLDKVKKENRNGTADFFAGLCYLYLQPAQYDSASTFLARAANTDGRFGEQATWYLALCYYQSNNLDLVEDILLEISSVEDHFRKEEASLLLKAIH